MALPQPDRMSGVAPAHVRHKPEQILLYQVNLTGIVVRSGYGCRLVKCRFNFVARWITMLVKVEIVKT